MKLNCDSANKIIKQLQADRNTVLSRERGNSVYSYMAGETPDIPEYDFAATQAELDTYTAKIVKLKHAVNSFNVETVLPEIGMTIDAALVRMAILNEEKQKLAEMRNAPLKRRTSTMRGVSEFTAINYNLEEVQARYKTVCDELVAIQQALNMANMTKSFDVDIEL